MIPSPLFLSNKYNQIKNFFVDVSIDEEKEKRILMNQRESYSYVNANLTINEKIEREKRRRYQAYMAFDYLLSVVSYFDFFSCDSFKIAKKAKELSQFFQKKIVTSEFLLLPFFEYTPELTSLLAKYGITEEEVSDIICSTYKLNDEKVETKFINSIKNFFINIDIPALSEILIVPKQTKYSYEINQIFEKAAENALTRFKTPVINAEILLITMLETKKSKVGKLLKQFLKTETNWYTLRYSLMKRLHNQELAIRTDVPSNQQYFAYLLKTQLTELQFEALIEKDCLLPGVLLFRNTLINNILQVDVYEGLKKDIFASIHALNERKYSVD